MTLPHGAQAAPGCDDSSPRVLRHGALSAPHLSPASLPRLWPATARHLVRTGGTHGRG